MKGIGYKKIYNILHANLHDIMPDGNIVKIAQSVCVRANAIANAELHEEFKGTYHINLKDSLTDRMNGAFHPHDEGLPQAKDGC
jgi:hypothetical protein